MDPRTDLPMIDHGLAPEDQAGCCLAPAQLSRRIEEWKQLAGMGLVEVSQKSDGLFMRYRRDPEVEGLLRHLVDGEKQCCSGLGFRISTGPDYLELDISGPWRKTPWAAAGLSPLLPSPPGDMREFVRSRYAALAQALGDGTGPSGPFCAAPGANGCGASYEARDLEVLRNPGAALSLGCGNVLGAARLKQGETVLDLGSGAGLEVLLAAKRVGPKGKAIGLDMTDEMLGAARANKAAAGLENAEFLKGYIEDIPLPAASVDVVISNCVINLSTAKDKVFAEMFRVLRQGGRLAVFDVVTDADLDPGARGDLDAWSNCLAGALTRDKYGSGLKRAGFQDASITESHEVQPGFSSVLVNARKP